VNAKAEIPFFPNTVDSWTRGQVIYLYTH